MVSDDERRRVAAALRDYASFDCEDEGEEECLVDCADWGERVLNLLGCGDTEGECYASLADLIDPDCEEGRYSVARTARPVDREALLALADELDRDGSLQRERQKAGERWFIDGLDVRDYARRIREACGMVDAG